MAFYSQAGLGQPRSYLPIDPQTGQPIDPALLQRMNAPQSNAPMAPPAGLGAVSTPPMSVSPTPAQPPSFNQRIQNGLGALFPVDPNSGIDPAYAKQLQNNAILKLGLGMVAAGRQPGASVGSALAAGLGGASNDLNGALQTAYRNALLAKQDKRATDAEQRAISEQQRQIENDRTNREFRVSESERAQGNFQTQQQRLEEQQKAEAEYRKQQLGLEGQRLQATLDAAKIRAGDAPNGYFWTGDPRRPLGFIPGGPADPSVSNSRNAGVPTEDERKAAGIAVRMENALNTITDISKKAPGSVTPNVSAAAASKLPVIGSVLENTLNSQDRQRVEAAQRDALDAALTLATGAAYTKQQFEDLKKSYFPQIGDDPKTIEEKRARLDAIIQTARIRAGRAAPTIDPILQGAPAAGLGSPPMQAPNGMQIFPNSQGGAKPNPAAIAQRAQGYYGQQ